MGTKKKDVQTCLLNNDQWMTSLLRVSIFNMQLGENDNKINVRYIYVLAYSSKCIIRVLRQVFFCKPWFFNIIYIWPDKLLMYFIGKIYCETLVWLHNQAIVWKCWKYCGKIYHFQIRKKFLRFKEKKISYRCADESNIFLCLYIQCTLPNIFRYDLIVFIKYSIFSHEDTRQGYQMEAPNWITSNNVKIEFIPSSTEKKYR